MLSEENAQYVALSHVWADGLENARRNALARCQISRLSKLVKALNVAENKSTQELFLWCDTLCCLTEPDDAKNLALSRMTRTYEKAAFVLVLTSALLIHNSESLSYEEMWTRIMISPWMHRVWTLQEAVLGANDRRLWFQFKDKAVRSRTITWGIYARCEPTVGRIGIMQFLLTGMHKIFFPDSIECHERGVGLSEVDMALQGRSISYAFDEPLVIGTLLGLDTDKIPSGPKSSHVVVDARCPSRYTHRCNVSSLSQDGRAGISMGPSYTFDQCTSYAIQATYRPGLSNFKRSSSRARWP